MAGLLGSGARVRVAAWGCAGCRYCGVTALATRDIAIGEELTQECAPTTAELVYRYGFAPSLNEVTPPSSSSSNATSAF